MAQLQLESGPAQKRQRFGANQRTTTVEYALSSKCCLPTATIIMEFHGGVPPPVGVSSDDWSDFVRGWSGERQERERYFVTPAHVARQIEHWTSSLGLGDWCRYHDYDCEMGRPKVCCFFFMAECMFESVAQVPGSESSKYSLIIAARSKRCSEIRLNIKA